MKLELPSNLVETPLLEVVIENTFTDKRILSLLKKIVMILQKNLAIYSLKVKIYVIESAVDIDE